MNRAAQSSPNSCGQYASWFPGVPAFLGPVATGKIAPPGNRDKRGKATAHLDFMDVRTRSRVKQKDKVGRPGINWFEAMMARADRTNGSS